MTDIFDTKIHCKKDGSEMEQTVVERNGFELRAVRCPKCGDTIIHPADLNSQEHFNDLKDRKFNVKLRMVGNSHAISIPKEIINFMNIRQREMHRHMDDMVSLWFDDFDTLKLGFFEDEFQEDEIGNNQAGKNEEYEHVLNDGRRVRRKVRTDGKGNIEVLEEQSLNSPNQKFKSYKIRKIRSYKDER
jgi:hypothetical protein